MNRYGKAFAAVAGAVLTALYVAVSGDNRIEPDEWIQVCVALATAVGVYLVPLDARFGWGKTAVGVVLSVLQVLTTVILGGLEPGEWMMLALAALTALGVAVAPAVSNNGVAANTAAKPNPEPGATDVV